MPETRETVGGDTGSISAALLNEAMASLGLAGIHFDDVNGKPLLRKHYDELTLERFIGLLLKGIAELHIRRSSDAVRLDQLDETLQRLGAHGLADKAALALADAASLVGDIRHSLTAPVFTAATELPATRLTIGRDD